MTTLTNMTTNMTTSESLDRRRWYVITSGGIVRGRNFLLQFNSDYMYM